MDKIKKELRKSKLEGRTFSKYEKDLEDSFQKIQFQMSRVLNFPSLFTTQELCAHEVTVKNNLKLFKQMIETTTEDIERREVDEKWVLVLLMKTENNLKK